jgi:hypothetical protein
VAQKINVAILQKRKRDEVDGSSLGGGFARASVKRMRSIQTRNKGAKSTSVVHAELRKSLLVWGLLLCGVFLAGLMVGRTPRNSNEKPFASEATLTAVQSDSFGNRSGWSGKP